MNLDGSIALWATVVAFGAYHGLNPAMGWPLAVASGLSAGRESAVLTALMPLAAGHLIAMAAVLLPFALLSELVAHRQAVQLGAGSLVLLFGVYKLANRRQLQSARPRPKRKLIILPRLPRNSRKSARLCRRSKSKFSS